MGATAILTVLSLVVVWVLFHVERVSSRLREMGSALGLLQGIQAGLFGEDGWGRTFFSTNWTEALSHQRADETAGVIKGQDFEYLFPVPGAPSALESLVASPYVGDLISMETVKWTSIGLYKLNVFAHFVAQQSRLLERHFHDVLSLQSDDPDLAAFAQVFSQQSFMLHRHGLGEPNGPGGWFWELGKSIERDVSELSCDRRNVVYPRGTRSVLISGDVLAACAALATLIVVLST